jgi:hypothetical protein
LGENAVVVFVSAPMVIPMSFDVGGGGGAFEVDVPVVLLLHPAVTASRADAKSNRKERMDAPRG